jgi:hypothetical protein
MLRAFGVDLPRRWARPHDTVMVAFADCGELLGWHCHVIGDDGAVLLGFPWTDHVDVILSGDELGELPIQLGEDGWDDLDQGWWGCVIVDGPDLYLAETDHDAISSVVDSTSLRPGGQGIVLVEGVEVRWNSVGRTRYDAAWRSAIETCRQGTPSPVGKPSDDYRRFVFVAEEQDSSSP